MRIIGIKLYDTKWHTINKILKPGWFPFGDYPEPEEDKPYILPNRTETVVRLYDLYENNPHIEVSCLVGMNGAGKSTLLDILYRLINNYAVEVLGSKKDNQHGRYLKYADGLKAELYYELEGCLYKISCHDAEVRFFEQNNDKYFVEHRIKQEDLSEFDHFFYTISNNYSLYSLNEKEYNEVIEEKKDGKDVSDKIFGYWVDGLFHKNDGYLSPIVITPYRESGSVDIENENDLAMQRIAAIAVLGVAQKQPSILDGYCAVSVKYRINRSYKRKIDSAYTSKWERYFKRPFFDAILKAFEDVWASKLGSKLKRFNERSKEDDLNVLSTVTFIPTTKKDLILQYLSYKTFKICMTYDDYYSLFKVDEVLKANVNKDDAIFSAYPIYDDWKTKHTKQFTDVVDRLCNHKHDSHINLKIRQCLNYVDSSVYIEDKGTVDIETIINGKNVVAFDDAVRLLPPAFFSIDLKLKKEEVEIRDGEDKKEEDVEMTVSTLSSGERQLLYTMSYVLYHVKNIQSVKNSNNCHQYHHINLVFDEAELYYHPEYQKQFVKKLIDYIARCNLDKNIIKSINVIIATHSPFVLTDILTQNTLYLANGECKQVERQSFGANYYDLLHVSFFFDDTALGSVSTKRIKEWLTGVNEKGEKVARIDEMEVQELIGDPLIVNYLLSGLYVQDKL